LQSAGGSTKEKINNDMLGLKRQKVPLKLRLFFSVFVSLFTVILNSVLKYYLFEEDFSFKEAIFTGIITMVILYLMTPYFLKTKPKA
jgi:hypothetical protein